MTMSIQGKINFPKATGIRCLMMPFIQGDPDSVPSKYSEYFNIIEKAFIKGQEGKRGLLTIDEKFVTAGTSQRGQSSANRAVHTEACQGKHNSILRWGYTWGQRGKVTLEPSTRVLIANSIDDTCAVWDQDAEPTIDGDLKDNIDLFPLEAAHKMAAGELIEIGVKTPHECIRQPVSSMRQFFRVVGEGTTGREDHFTINPMIQ